MKSLRSPFAVAALLAGIAAGSCERAPSTPTDGPLERVEALPEQAHAVLAPAGALEIFALDPTSMQTAEPPEGETLHGYEILGRATLADPATCRALLGHVYAGIAADDGIRALCFDPRHGIRARSGEDVVELVICFECFQVRVHGPGDARTNLGTVQRVEPAVSRIYRDAGLAIAD